MSKSRNRRFRPTTIRKRPVTLAGLAAQLARRTGEKLSEKHYTAARILQAPPLANEAENQAANQMIGGQTNLQAEKSGGVSHVSQTVAKPTITLVTFSDAVQVNIGSQRYRTMPIQDAYLVEQLLIAIENQTGAVAIARVDLSHIES